MKNKVKLFVAMRSIAIIALAALIVFAACDNGNGNSTGGGDITWEVAQVGGVPGTEGAAPTESTTAITITFSGKVTLTDADFTISGAAERDNSAQLSSAGNVWTVPVTVEHTDFASIEIDKDGVKKESKDVLVYKKGEVQAINYTAVADGVASTTTSTKITLTFSAAVDGLMADDITIHSGTGTATKGALTGSGTIWVLNIFVETQGSISIEINKSGISANTRPVQVYKEASNPITDGLITYINTMDQLVFSYTNGDSGTYIMNSPKAGIFGPDLEDGKYIWDKSAEGTWTWNRTAQTITLTMTKVVDDDGTTMLERAEAEAKVAEMVADELQYVYDSTYEYMLEDYLDEQGYNGYDYTQEEAEELARKDALNAAIDHYDSDYYETLEEVIEAVIAMMLEVFDPKPYTYTHSSDGESLILLEPLPASVGSNELSGKTYFYSIGYPDEDHTYVFTAESYIETIPPGWMDPDGDNVIKSGSYSYNSTTKRVYLKPSTVDGVTPLQYYDDIDTTDISNPYPDEAAYRTATTHSWFQTTNNSYDPDPDTLTIRPRG